MTPAKRRPATPASQGPTRVAPDVPTAPPDAPVPDELMTAAEVPPEVPTVADPPPVPPRPIPGGVRAPDVPTAPPDAPLPDELAIALVPPAAEDGTELLGPNGEPMAQDAPTADAGGGSAPPTETGQVDAEDRATTQPPGRSRGRYPLPVWPD
jgi:hypothetical protein